MSRPGDARRGTAWRDEDRIVLRRLVLTGLTCEEVATAMGRSPGAVNNKINELGLTLADEMIRNAYIRRRWTEWPINEIARAMRLPVPAIVQIGQSLGLSRADMPRAKPGPKPAPKRAHEAAKARLRWAFDNRTTCREAALVWDMARVSRGMKPIGRGYSA